MRIVAAEVRTDLDELAALRDQARESLAGRAMDRYSASIRTVREQELLGFLAGRGVLPKYGFPVDVVSLRTEHVPDQEARRLDLSRDLRLAIGEYAPGSQVVAGKKVWESGGLYRLPGKAWPQYTYEVCQSCGRFHRDMGAGHAVCLGCGEPLRGGGWGERGTLIVPRFGFVARNEEPRPSGEARPRRGFASRVYFSHIDTASEVGAVEEAVIADLPSGALPVLVRYSRYGRLAVVNSGPNRRGYRVCESCGYGTPAPPPEGPTRRTTAERTHRQPRSGRECAGRLISCHLGHEFVSDILELRWEGAHILDRDIARWRSLLYAVLEGAAQALDIERSDLDGCLYFYAPGQPPALVLYDDVPGGAGHCRRIAGAIGDVLRRGLAGVASCVCGPETSCYECLRNYRNQPFHEELSRGAAATLLMRALGLEAAVSSV